ncbi:MAG: glycoside hydrolase family protein [Pseudomonadota bacterium]
MTPDQRIALRNQLKRDEGSGITKNGHFMPYTCTSGKLTIGWGHNITDNGIKPKFADLILDDDMDDAAREMVTRWPWTEALDPARQSVLINMLFNIGGARLNGFRKMLMALQKKDYEGAAVEMLASAWAEQVGDRSLRLAEQMRRGWYV